MSNIIDEYINGLQKIYKEKKGKNIKFSTHATEDEINLIKKNYPDVPKEFIEFLKRVDGRIKIDDEENFVYLPTMFSIMEGNITYPMCNVNDILKHHAEYKNDTLAELYPWFLEEDVDEDESATEEIDLYSPIGDRLLFADNGGHSQLYIDLKPSPLGKLGQIIAYVHDPDSYFLVCNSFSELLKESIDTSFAYFFDEFDEDEL